MVLHRSYHDLRDLAIFYLLRWKARPRRLEHQAFRLDRTKLGYLLWCYDRLNTNCRHHQYLG